MRDRRLLALQARRSPSALRLRPPGSHRGDSTKARRKATCVSVTSSRCSHSPDAQAWLAYATFFTLLLEAGWLADSRFRAGFWNLLCQTDSCELSPLKYAHFNPELFLRLPRLNRVLASRSQPDKAQQHSAKRPCLHSPTLQHPIVWAQFR